MYEPLGVDPLPPGPLINNPAAPLLRLLLRAFNVALAALGLLLIAASLWMGQEYRGSDDGDSGGGDSGGDDLSSSGGGSGGFGGGGAAAGVASFPWCALMHPCCCCQLWACPDAMLPASHHPSATKHTLYIQPACLRKLLTPPTLALSCGCLLPCRFIYATGVVGAYCFATALCGLAGVTRQRRRQLALYLLLLALLVVAQAGATVLLLTDNAWRQHIPGGWGGVENSICCWRFCRRRRRRRR